MIPNSAYTAGTIVVQGLVGRDPDITCRAESAFGRLEPQRSDGGSIGATVASEVQVNLQAEILSLIKADARFSTKYSATTKLDNIRTFTISDEQLVTGLSDRTVACREAISNQMPGYAMSILKSVLVADVVVSFASSGDGGVSVGVDASQVADYIKGKLGASWALDKSNELRGDQLTLGYVRSDNQAYIRPSVTRSDSTVCPQACPKDCDAKGYCLTVRGRLDNRGSLFAIEGSGDIPKQKNRPITLSHFYPGATVRVTVKGVASICNKPDGSDPYDYVLALSGGQLVDQVHKLSNFDGVPPPSITLSSRFKASSNGEVKVVLECAYAQGRNGALENDCCKVGGLDGIAEVVQ